MSLAADRRGRVPFALVGVLLLVGATTYAAGLADRTPATVERPATETMDGATRDARPALRVAVQDAARASMRHPVTEPADTPAGRALNESQPYLDVFRVRVAVAARERLRSVERRRDGIRATVSLPPIDDAEGLSRAKRDVQVTGLPENRSVRVTLQNVSVRASRGGTLLNERTVNVTLVVSTPVLALHDRAERYEERLNRGPLQGPGLGRGLTARLYPVTWIRAYGRYQGAPIRNVLGNRHVELLTNGALLGQQRAVFGRADPDGARATQVATARVGVTDVLGSSGRTDRVAGLLRPNAVDDGEEYPSRVPDEPAVTERPDAAADEVYLDAVGRLEADLESSYRVRASLHTDVALTDHGRRPPTVPPGENYSLVATTESQRTAVHGVDSGTAPTPSPARLERSRRVVVTHVETRYWAGPDGVERRVAEWRDRYRVDVAVVATYVPEDGAPERPVEPLFRRGGALNESNLDGVASASTRELLAANGGVDGVAASAVRGDDLRRRTVRTGAPSEEVRGWVARDLGSLRERVANVSVTVPRRRAASGDANPAGRLAAALSANRASLVDAPDRYGGVADRARVAARAAYVDAVIRQLEARAAEADARNQDYLDAVGDRTAVDVSKLVAIGAANDGAFRRRGGSTAGDALVTVPDGSPAYLTLEPVTDDHVPSVPAGPSVHPLAARNVNWFTVPYGDAADGVAGALFPDEPSVSLAAASQALVAANRTASEGESAEFDGKRGELAADVADAVEAVDQDTCEVLRTEEDVPLNRCRGAVEATRQRWDGSGRRGLAIANGSYARAIGDELRVRGLSPARADVAAIRLRVAHRELAARPVTAVDAGTTDETVEATRSLAREATTELVETELENATERTTARLTGGSRIPAGLPVAPAPGYWYATVNGWSVTVRGEYQRFAVRSYAGAPDGAGGVVTYVRDGRAVTLDVDGDGEAERLGTSERIAFETETVVVVALPPGPAGVGDVDGDRDERSAGWPCPGVDTAESCAGGE